MIDAKGLIRTEDRKTAALPMGIEAISSNNGDSAEYMLCVLIDRDMLLIKYAERGVQQGKWNFPGGKIEPKETPIDATYREVIGETGLMVSDVSYHGFVDSYLGSNTKPNRVHILSSRSFEGNLRGSDEGEVKWVSKGALPIKHMWKDTQAWLGHVYQGNEFHLTVHYNNEKGDRIEMMDLKVTKRAKLKAV